MSSLQDEDRDTSHPPTPPTTKALLPPGWGPHRPALPDPQAPWEPEAACPSEAHAITLSLTRLVFHLSSGTTGGSSQGPTRSEEKTTALLFFHSFTHLLAQHQGPDRTDRKLGSA